MNGKDIRHYLHYIITIYLLFGGILTNNLYYINIHFYVTFFTVIHWLTNNGQCFISEMDYDKTEPNGYTKHLLEKLGLASNQKTVQLIAYGSVLIPCFYSLYKLNRSGVRPYLII
jgi:hypothetical protein